MLTATSPAIAADQMTRRRVNARDRADRMFRDGQYPILTDRAPGGRRDGYAGRYEVWSWRVPAQSNAGAYTVTATVNIDSPAGTQVDVSRCDCRAGLDGMPCKHRAAVEALMALAYPLG